jgi:hypothetical protein
MGLRNFLKRLNVPPSVVGGGAMTAHTKLAARHLVPDDRGNMVEVGKRRVVRDKVVTTAFVDFVVDQLIAETSVFGDFKYHEVGLGTNAEAVGDTALQTSSGIARATGTQVETDHDTYKSVGTITADATEAWTEHGLFNASSAGTLMDRTKFDAINVVSGNQVEFTFEISFTAGG